VQPGYKSRLKYSDAEYFNLSGKDARVATARREQRAPTLEQIRHVIGAMPSATELDCRNRTLIVFTLRGLLPDRSMLMGAIVIIDKSISLRTRIPGNGEALFGRLEVEARDFGPKSSATFVTFRKSLQLNNTISGSSSDADSSSSARIRTPNGKTLGTP
jgi:hypothetical protein